MIRRSGHSQTRRRLKRAVTGGPRARLTAAARYSSHLFATIDNSDIVGHTYQGFESYLVVDARATWKLDPHWSVAVGVDNLNNRDYFVFHPFPQRSVLAELHYVY